jgi:hypothetical protein
LTWGFEVIDEREKTQLGGRTKNQTNPSLAGLSVSVTKKRMEP